MEYLLELLGSFIEDETQLRIVFLTLTALSMFLFAGGLAFLLTGVTDPVRRRLASITATSGGQARNDQQRKVTLEKVLEPASKYVLPKKEWEKSRISALLVHAGYRSSSALTTFYGLKTILAVVCPIVVLFATRFFPDLSNQHIFFLAVLAAFIGVTGPNIFLNRKVESRKRLLRSGFPDVLDLLVICVESGLGLVAAIQRVANDLDVSHPELSEELALVGAETRMGVQRMDALKNLASRTGLEEIHSLVVLLDQSARFGTSIADALRVYAEEFRDKRMQKAEEEAAKIGTKLIFPLTACLWPSFFLVAIGPAIVRILQAFGSI